MMNEDTFKFGLECGLELCIREMRLYSDKTEALAKMEGFLNAVKNDKLDRLKLMSDAIKG